MKKIVGSILAVILIVTLIGCSNAANQSDRQITDNNISSSSNPETPKEKEYTKDNALDALKADKDFKNYEIIECVLKDDDEVPILKAVISFYDKQKNNSCNLAFILENSVQKICFAVNEVEGVKTFQIEDGNHLSYIGNGAVATSIRKIETNEIFDYKIIFSYDESNSTSNFEVLSGKRTN